MTAVPYPCHPAVPRRAGTRATPVPAQVARARRGVLTCAAARLAPNLGARPCQAVPSRPGGFR